MNRKISVFIAILTITALGKSFGAFPVKQLSLNQNSLTGNISSTEKYKMATRVFRLSDFQKTGYKQSALNTFISNNSSVYEKSDIRQNVMTGFSWRNQQSNGHGVLITGLVFLGASLACFLAGGLMGVPDGAGLGFLGAILFLPGLIVTICGLATN